MMGVWVLLLLMVGVRVGVRVMGVRVVRLVLVRVVGQLAVWAGGVLCCVRGELVRFDIALVCR